VQECESVEGDRFGVSTNTPGRASETHQIEVSSILVREAGDSSTCSRLSSPAASFNERESTTKNNVQGYILHVWACTTDLRLPLTFVLSLSTEAIYAALSSALDDQAFPKCVLSSCDP